MTTIVFMLMVYLGNTPEQEEYYSMILIDVNILLVELWDNLLNLLQVDDILLYVNL